MSPPEHQPRPSEDSTPALEVPGILTFRGNGRGALAADAQVEVPDWRRGCSGYGLRIVDTDGDGPAELIASFAGERALTDGMVRCPSGGGIEVWHVHGR